ncbi:MAG: alpha/beta hydrolase [Planctomycetota bacterium]|jgi:pimeloyl-ACP methyl ester carboxylesterase
MRKSQFPILLGIIAVLSAHQAPAVSPQNPGEVLTEERSLETRDGEVIEYELGTIYVPENRNDPDSRLIGLGFARIRAGEEATGDVPPVFRLPGGPGSSFLDRLKVRDKRQRQRAIEGLAQFRKFTDVVLVDQRGFSAQGGEEILRATFRMPPQPTDRPSTLDDLVQAYKGFAKAAVDEYLVSEVDLAGYNVIECAHDVADLSAALGYDQIILNGTSFGSQWSFAIMKLHPDIVARALLSGVEPLDSGYDMPSYVFAAVQRMWRSIDADPRFKPYLPEGGMAAAAEAVIKRLEKEPIQLGSGDSRGFFGPMNFPWNEPTEILELYHGHTARWEREASGSNGEQRQSMPLIGALIDSSLATTPERAHRLWTDPAIRYLSRRNFAIYMATADTWPSPDVGDEFRTPEVCEIPVVFAQGDWDTQTPLENTFEIAPFFVNSRVIVAEGGGHGVFGPISAQHPEIWQQVEEFVVSGDMEGIPGRVRLEPSRRFTPPSFAPAKR